MCVYILVLETLIKNEYLGHKTLFSMKYKKVPGRIEKLEASSRNEGDEQIIF